MTRRTLWEITTSVQARRRKSMMIKVGNSEGLVFFVFVLCCCCCSLLLLFVEGCYSRSWNEEFFGVRIQFLCCYGSMVYSG